MTGRPHDERVTLRSYRLAFELERRLHRIDRFRIPVPYGVPLSSLGYGAAVLALLVVASRLPIAGPLLGLMPWPIRLILLPALGAHLLCRTGRDGRPAHEALAARLVFLGRPRRLAALQRSPGGSTVRLADITIGPDETDAAYRRARVVGPARAVLRQPARASIRGNTIEVEQVEDRPMFRPRELQLGAGQVVILR